MVREIGLLDERFFAYQEELEWCIRAKRKGWSIVQTPMSKIWHSGVIVNYEPKPYVTYYMTRNWLLILREYHAGIIIWGNELKKILRTLLSWTLRPKWRDKRIHRDAMMRAVIDFFKGKFGPMTS